MQLHHSFVVGPVVRLLYLAVLVVPLAFLALRMVGPVQVLVPTWVFVAVFVGYLASQWLHLLCDRMLPDVGFGRPVRRRRGRS